MIVTNLVRSEARPAVRSLVKSDAVSGWHYDFKMPTRELATIRGGVLDFPQSDITWAFNSQGLLLATPHNLLENPNWSEQTGAAPSGWTDEFGVGTTTFIDNGDGSFSAVFVAANNRPHSLNAITVVAEEIYSASIYVTEADISAGNDLLLYATSTGGTNGDIDLADIVALGGVPGWFAVAFQVGAGEVVASLRVGPGGSGSATGSAKMKEPSITKGYLPEITALNTPVKLSGPPLGRWVGTDDGDEPRYEPRFAAHYQYGGAWVNGGYQVELAATQDCPEPIDMTDASWVVSGAGSDMTVAKDAIGLDGEANSACTLTVVNANATILNTITKALANNTYRIWGKHLLGSGDWEMTLDGGTTWATIPGITPSYFPNWTVESPTWVSPWITQNLANPSFGIRGTTVGDKIIIGLNDMKTGTKPNSPIPVGGATRPADPLSTAIMAGFDPTKGTFRVKAHTPFGFDADNFLIEVRADANNRTYLHVPTATEKVTGKIITASTTEFDDDVGNALIADKDVVAGLAYAADDAIAVADGLLSANDTDVGLWQGAVKISFGMDGADGNQWGGFIESVEYF